MSVGQSCPSITIDLPKSNLQHQASKLSELDDSVDLSFAALRCSRNLEKIQAKFNRNIENTEPVPVSKRTRRQQKITRKREEKKTTALRKEAEDEGESTARHTMHEHQ